MPSTSSICLKLGGILGSTAVIAGAYGSHGLEAHFQKDLPQLDEADMAKWKGVWETSQKIHLFGAVSSIALVAPVQANLLTFPKTASALIVGGTAIFASSCYLGAYFSSRDYSKAAPLGGISLILGFALLAL